MERSKEFIVDRLLTYLLILLVGVGIGLLCRPSHTREVTKKVSDTLIVIDTHIIEKPVLVEKTQKETLLVAVHDTTIVNDSVFVPIIIEKKTYKGEDYFAEISGYNAILERIEVYPKTVTITKTQTVTKCNHLALGFEAMYFRTPYIPIYLEYERMLLKNVGIFGRVMYNIPTMDIGISIGAELKVGW